jgi:glyoxylase-like metal-dependent hydrolase (beta-lactamase superfamily II)
MNELEQQLHYPLGDTLLELGCTIELRPGVRWLRMALPFALNHINLWLLRDQINGCEGWTIVDCGIANDATRQAWLQIFENELQGLPVLRVVVTHMHPDHVGLAHWLTEHWSEKNGEECRLWMSGTDFAAARIASSSTAGFGGERSAAFMASHGLLDEESLHKIRARSNYYPTMVPALPASYRRMMEGDVLHIGGHEWTCHAGYGHAPEHIALYSPALKTLISGDMVLPRISTNISVIDLEPEADPLPLYLNSIERHKALPPDTLVLPSHGKPFEGLHTRIDQLHQHHGDRLAEVVEACSASPCSAADLLPVMFKRPLDLHQTTFAMGEAIAHLHALWHEGKLRRERDGGGVWRFSAESVA